MKKLILSTFFLALSVVFVKAHPAWGIVVDKDRNIYFADIGHNGMGTVWKLDKEGRLTALLKDFHAHNVSLDKEGNLYTAHGEGTHRLVKLPVGKNKFETIINERDENRYFGGNTTVSPSGKIYFGIRKYIWQYEPGRGARKFNPKRLEWNQAVFADEDDNIYVPDKAVGNGTLFKLTADGRAEKIADDLLSRLDRPRDRHNDVLLGIGKDKKGDIFVAESAGQRIIRIPEKGKPETFYRSEKDFIPTGITFFEDETYILEFGKNRSNPGPRIVRINKNGVKKKIFDYAEYRSPVSGNLNVVSASGNVSSTAWFYIILLPTILIVGFWSWRKLFVSE